MRWQRVARVGVAAIGIGTAGALYLLTRPRIVSHQVGSSTPADPNATLQSGSGTTLHFKDNKMERKLEYQAVLQYADGRVGWTVFRLSMSDGTMVTADQADTVGKATTGDMPLDVILKGHVRFQMPDGLQFQAEQVHYVDGAGEATIPGAASFTRGRLSGTGTGAIYERDTGVFRLLADAHVTTQPDDPGGRLDATASTMTFTRASNSLLFDEHARIAHDADLMTADRATLDLTDEHEQFKAIELRGNSRVTPTPGQNSNTPDMQGQDIDLSFYDGTQALQRAVVNRTASMLLVDGVAQRSIAASTIVLMTAPDGKTVTHIEGVEHVTVKTPPQNDAPARTITASSLVASGDEKAGLTAAQFTGGVRFEELIPASAGRASRTRVGTSQLLNLKLKGQLDAIDEAQFQQNVRFDDGDVSGSADQGVYAATKGLMTLQPFARNGKLTPKVTDGNVTVYATELIDVDLNTNDLHARKDVKTITAGQAATDKPAGVGLFNQQETTFGFGAEFWYTGATKDARYVGTPSARARLKQTESEVIGLELTAANQTQNLTGRGSVESTFPLSDQGTAGSSPAQSPGRGSQSTGKAAASAGAPMTVYQVTAETLDYVDAARTATYTGAPVKMTSPDRSTQSKTLVLTLAEASRTLDRLEGTSDVHVTLPAEGREALADALLYEAARERYTLRGHVLLRDPGDKPGTCSLVKGTVGYFTNGDKAPVFPPEEQGAGGFEKSGTLVTGCTGELKR